VSAEPSSPPNADRWTVRRVLEWTTSHLQSHGSETPRLDAEILLAHDRQCDRVQLYTQYAHELTDRQRAVMRDLVKRRANAEPVAYLVGHREFFSLDFKVTPETLIPRPETETLVVELLERAGRLDGPRILDIGTGSGCIAIAAAVNLPATQLTAVDLSEAALSVAQENAETHGVADRVVFLHGDLFEPLEPGRRFDVIVSNPPYVREDEFATLPETIRWHEPKSALVSGVDGLEVVRRLIADAPQYLVPGGSLLIEIAPEQATAVKERLAERFADVKIVQDLSRVERVAIGTV